MKTTVVHVLTNLWFFWCDTTRPLEIDALPSVKEAVLVDKVLHYLPFFGSELDLFIFTFI